MELNAYQPCPCHAEQKIKFCCGKQIVDDLNQVMALARGNQTLATLDKLDRLIAERGPKDCLLTLKTHYLIRMMEIGKARECNDAFLKTNPKHPIGMQHQAMICLAENNIVGAINALQDAMDGIKGTAVPVALGNAFRMVGSELFRNDFPLAARQHLRFAVTLNPNDDLSKRLINQSFRIQGRSLLFKQNLDLPAPPADKPWTKTYQQLRRTVARGQWRSALQYLEVKLQPQFPTEPTLIKAAAVLALWLGQNEKAADAWSAFAALPTISVDEAIEAELWAQLLRGQTSTRSFELLLRTIPLDDLDRVVELMSASDRFVRISPDFDDDDGPPPKAGFEFLDRPRIQPAEGLAPNQIPSALAEVFVYGKQTDRPARLEFDVVADGNDASVEKELAQSLANSVDFSQGKREPFGTISELQYRLMPRWRIPSGLTRMQLSELLNRQEEMQLSEIWPQIPMAALDDQAPQDVIGNPKYQIKLQALVGDLVLSDLVEEISPAAIERLREKLQLPKAEPIDPRQLAPSSGTLLQIHRIQWELAPDDVLTASFLVATNTGQWNIVRKTGQEILKRTHLESTTPFENVCLILANITKDDEESLNYLRQARKIVHAKGQPLGDWLVAELEHRLKRNIGEKTAELFEEIRLRHLHEPNVEARLQRLIAAMGLAENADRPDERGGDASPDGGENESSPIWTPESAGSATGTGKLWLPGD